MLDKRYDHKAVEEGKYRKWVEEEYFKGGQDKSKPPFSMVIPPPNVTGKLHLGHVMDTVPADILCRYKRMKGYDVLWVPGVDHAGIATQAKVEEKLRHEGVSRFDLGREKFLEKAFEWKEEYAKTIHEQWAKLGLSVDYSRERFTLDEGMSEAVKKVFVTLYEQGLIYRGERIINWDPELKTALSDIEVVHQDDEGEFFYFRYEVAGEDDVLIVATTRPETMFGDTAIFVNPNDPRYAHLIGKKSINPANDEALPIMADEYVDIEFGTGAMKCTPAHDPNDFALAKKYGFPFIKVLDEEAKMNEKAGKYAGMDRYECRKALVEDIKKAGKLEKIEHIVHSVGHSERSGAVVEPMLSKQWFVKMRPLADKVLENQASEGAVKFVPDRFAKVLERWMNEVSDWCVSRQLWWGHRIPAYYHKKTKEVVVAYENPDPDNYEQDEDVLDTWFSSGLWPFGALGWPKEGEDFKRYFPTSALVTGYDIIFFWVARMTFQSLHFTDKAPFEEVIIHGLIRDEQGRKMSKSLGNGIDPIDVIDRYGVDALRYFISTNSTPGQDMRYSEEKLTSSANYLNKIWNAVRYVEGVLGDEYAPKALSEVNLSTLDKGIIDRLQKAIASITEAMDTYQFGQASTMLYDFVYDDFCSSYLEQSKVMLSYPEFAEATKATLYHVVKTIILLISPYCPFISEEMYLSLPYHKESINLEEFPKYDESLRYGKEEEGSKLLETMIKDVRNYKSERGLAPNSKVRIIISPSEPFPLFKECLSRFSFAKEIVFSSEELKGNPFIYHGYEMTIEEDIDKGELLAKLTKEKDALLSEIARSEKMLSNPGFVAKAPREKIALEEGKLKKNKELLEAVERKISESK